MLFLPVRCSFSPIIISDNSDRLMSALRKSCWRSWRTPWKSVLIGFRPSKSTWITYKCQSVSRTSHLHLCLIHLPHSPCSHRPNQMHPTQTSLCPRPFGPLSSLVYWMPFSFLVLPSSRQFKKKYSTVSATIAFVIPTRILRLCVQCCGWYKKAHDNLTLTFDGRVYTNDSLFNWPSATD